MLSKTILCKKLDLDPKKISQDQKITKQNSRIVRRQTIFSETKMWHYFLAVPGPRHIRKKTKISPKFFEKRINRDKCPYSQGFGKLVVDSRGFTLQPSFASGGIFKISVALILGRFKLNDSARHC